MAMQAIRAVGKEAVPGVPSRLRALAGEAFGTFALPLSGTATLLATAQISPAVTFGLAAVRRRLGKILDR